MKTIEKQGFKEAKMLEEQRDFLRSELSAMSRFGQFDQKKSDLLQRLDKLFFLQCDLHGLEISKFGRLK